MAYTSYNTIGAPYDRTRAADPYLSDRLVDLLSIPTGAALLDVGCGTGNYAVMLSNRGYQVTGVDPSERMLEQARKKSDGITWLQGKAEALPLPDASFDGAIATLTTHHWTDLAAGFREVHRTLRPGGRLVLLTSTPEQMQRYWLCHYFPQMMARSCSVMPTAETTLAALHAAGFSHFEQEAYAVRPDLKDLFLYAAKDDPARYLDPEFRKGISSFAALANADEVETGLLELAKDIESGRWGSIQASYGHGGGDYLFVVSTKA